MLPSGAVAVWTGSPLGRDYRRLWVANAVSVAGDGVTVTAGPLLAASITHDPLLVVKRLLARSGASLLLRIGLIIECATHVSLALTRRPWVAALTLAVFGAHNGVWNVVTVTLRQTAIPGHLLGRVNSVYYTFAMGGFAVGSLAGGLLARDFGLTAPFWVAAAAIAVVAVLAWRLFTPGHLTTEQKSLRAREPVRAR